MEELLRAKLEKAGQEHVLQWLGEVEEAEKKAFLQHLESIDLGQLKQFATAALHRRTLTESKDLISPFEDVYKLADAEERAKCRQVGLQLIAEGKVGAVLMAGGQGTRLGSKDPKGMYDVGLLSKKSLYQLQAERLRRLCGLAAVQQAGADEGGADGVAGGASAPVIPWYIMTSEHTRERTERFFQERSYFGLSAADVKFFEQGQYPALDEDGKLILQGKAKIAMAPNGNGGIYSACVEEGVLEDLEKRGVQYVFVYGVDNIAIKMCDPTFVGLLALKEGDVGVKVVPKKVATERVGVLAHRNGKPSVVEYSEIDDDVAAKRRADGSLLFNTGNICIHLFTLDFLKRCGTEIQHLTKHVAHKKIPRLSEDGQQLIQPEAPNGFKFEMFVFDVFPLAKQMLAMMVERDEEFMPLKNAPGTADSNPDTCRSGLSALHKRYVEENGGKVVVPQDLPQEEALVEISPLVSFDGEGLAAVVQGKTFTAPVLIEEEQSASKL